VVKKEGEKTEAGERVAVGLAVIAVVIMRAK